VAAQFNLEDPGRRPLVDETLLRRLRQQIAQINGAQPQEPSARREFREQLYKTCSCRIGRAYPEI
jgi:hypothetical protein